MTALGKAIVERRYVLRLKQEDVAALGGPSVATLRLLEQGVGRPRAKTLGRLDAALGWRPGSALALLRGETNEPALAEPLTGASNNGAAEIRVEITTHVVAANGDAEMYSVTRSYSVTDNPLFWEDEADKALMQTVHAQRDNLAGRFSRNAFGVPA